MAEPTSCCAAPGGYRAGVDVLFNLPGTHVVDVGWRGGRLLLTVETRPAAMGCSWCWVIAESHGRRQRLLHDVPAFGATVG
jgi:hypothetical protein